MTVKYKQGKRGTVDPGRNGVAPKCISIPKTRVEPWRQEKYMAAFMKRAKGSKGLTWSVCVREALDAWSEGLLRGS